MEYHREQGSKNRRQALTGTAMGIFNSNKHNGISPASWYVRLKTSWADWMALRTAGLTKKGWLAALSCFVLLIGSYSGYLIVSAFTGAPTIAIKVGSIHKPAHTDDTGEQTVQARISDADYQRIKKFHKYIDSLARDPAGKRTYDSIIVKRPGLMDSVIQVEKYYQQFKIK